MRSTAAIVALAVIACGSSKKGPDPGELAGQELAAGVTFARSKAAELSEPYRCAAWVSDEQAEPISIAAGKTNLEIEGRRAALRIEGQRSGAAIAVAFVADARGAQPPTIKRLHDLARELDESGVHLVVSLGGMGTTQDELSESLGALADGAFVVIAIPGDRESIPAHRAAIAELSERGAGIVDGSLVRLIANDHIAIGTFPGVEHGEQLVAQSDGCQHFPEDAASLAKRMSEHSGVRVWASYAPPRQSGESGSDLTLSGVHVGETMLVDSIARAGAHLVVHGLVDESSWVSARGDLRVSDGARVIVGAGSVDTLPLRQPRKPAFGGSALVASVSPRRVKWRRIVFEIDN